MIPQITTDVSRRSGRRSRQYVVVLSGNAAQMRPLGRGVAGAIKISPKRSQPGRSWCER